MMWTIERSSSSSINAKGSISSLNNYDYDVGQILLQGPVHAGFFPFCIPKSWESSWKSILIDPKVFDLVTILMNNNHQSTMELYSRSVNVLLSKYIYTSQELWPLLLLLVDHTGTFFITFLLLLLLNFVHTGPGQYIRMYDS